MCASGVYNKEHVPIPDDSSSGCVRPMAATSSQGALISLGNIFNFIDNWLQ